MLVWYKQNNYKLHNTIIKSTWDDLVDIRAMNPIVVVGHKIQYRVYMDASPFLIIANPYFGCIGTLLCQIMKQLLHENKIRT